MFTCDFRYLANAYAVSMKQSGMRMASAVKQRAHTGKNLSEPSSEKEKEKMEKVKFIDPDTEEEIEFFVEEETQINGTRYLLVTEEQEGDCDAYILKEVASEEKDVWYEMVEDETELAAIGKVFAELIDDADISY